MLLAVYGTLRENLSSHERWLSDYNLIVTERVEGFEMFNFRGARPYVARGADHITVEVYDISSEIMAAIEEIERGNELEVVRVKTTAGIAKIFCTTEERHAQYQSNEQAPPKIISGDWVEWTKKYRPSKLRGVRGDGLIMDELEGDTNDI